jgi:type II secretory pathway component PulF
MGRSRHQPSRRTGTLGDVERAAVLQGLARLLRSGIDPDRALGIAAGDAGAVAARRLRRVQQALRQGRPLDGALVVEQLLTSHEGPRMAAALETGQPEEALEAVADGLVRRHRLRRQIAQRLIPAGAILLVALVVTPLPAIARGDLTVARYLTGVAAQLVLVGVVLGLAWRWAEPAVRCLRDALLALRGRPTLAQREALTAELASLLGAGLSAERALASVGAGREMGRRVMRAQRLLPERGMVAALAAMGLLDPSRDRPSLAAAEQAGRLAPGLAHHARLLGEDVARRRELIAEWLPRLAYGLVILWVVGGTLGGIVGLPGS